MGRLAIGISLITAIYALFLHFTFRYLLGNGNSKNAHLKGIVQSLMGVLGFMWHLSKNGHSKSLEIINREQDKVSNK